ncbi:DUF732 domain-containing protein [Mycolicibacterium mengxianglii]|uniref:DUF732 domain-containing protein n=1 Tax=Mycolicibacterium mengxianglii TaxID=2736649 RepID=UPI0027DA8A85|nr:DUF732 domain-containing protein [Mycolicibacterium mengxianglii]
MAAGILVVCAAVEWAPPAHADQYEFISFLDDSGVSYGSIIDMIDIGKAVCHDLRRGDTPPIVMGRLANAGFAAAEASLILVSAVSHMCGDAKAGVNAWAYEQQGYTGQAL